MAEEQEQKQEAKSTGIWVTIVAFAIKIGEVILQWFSNKSSNKEITIAEKNRKLQEALDENKKIIEEAHKTNNLDEIRKRLG